MESEGGGIAAATTPTTRRLSSQPLTLCNSYISSDIANGLNTTALINHNSSPTSPRPISNLTLGAVLNGDRKPPPPNNIVGRTFLEIIRNNETLNKGGASPNSKKSWKSFKEKVKRNKSQNLNSGSWVSSMPVPQSDVLPSSRSGRDLMMNRNSLRNSLRTNSVRRVDGVPADDMSLMEVDSGGSPRSGGSFRLSAAVAAEREETRRRLSRELDEDGKEDEIDVTGLATQGNKHEDEDEDEDEEEEDEEDGEVGPNFGYPVNQPMKMSLMDLLEETDRQAGIDGPMYRLDDDGEDDDEEEEEEEEEDDVAQELGKGEYSCSVCMVKHKGSAFIPCGHTFCRLCSKELFVQKGNCALCNNFILEILDIF